MRLQDYRAKRCLTANGWLLRNDQVLLVKHRLLGIWLSPGGHVEENELPHQAAEREFLEETGIRGHVISAEPLLSSCSTEYLPLPFMSNLHWINKPGDELKFRSGSKKACEQHYVFSYYLSCDGPCDIVKGDAGITDIHWFSKQEISELETIQEIRDEANYVFQHYPKHK